MFCLADESPSSTFSQSALRMRNFLKLTPFVFSFTERVKVIIILLTKYLLNSNQSLISYSGNW